MAAVEHTSGDEAVLPLGASSSVGSLPHLDREEAVAFVLRHAPLLPAAPTVPRLEPLEQMIPQGAWGIAGVRVDPDGTISVPDPALVDPEAPLGDPGLDDVPFTTWRLFLDRVADRTTPVKLQLTGPLTLGLTLVQAGLAPSLAFDVAVRAVRQRAGHLLDRADEVAPAARRVVVFDEPGLVGGLRPELELSPDGVIDLLSGALAAVANPTRSTSPSAPRSRTPRPRCPPSSASWAPSASSDGRPAPDSAPRRPMARRRGQASRSGTDGEPDAHHLVVDLLGQVGGHVEDVLGLGDVVQGQTAGGGHQGLTAQEHGVAPVLDQLAPLRGELAPRA